MQRTRIPYAPAFVAALVTIGFRPVPVRLVPQAGGGTPIDVEVRPSKTMPGGQVTFRGSAVPTGSGSHVSIAVQTPAGGKPVSLQAPVGVDGTYSVLFGQTSATGAYTVQVTAPDGKSKVSATLYVVAPGVIPAAVADDTEELLTASRDALQIIRKTLAGLPPSSSRQQADAQLAEAEERTSEALKQVPFVRKTMTDAFQARASVEEDNPAWDEYVDELEVWQENAADRAAALRSTIGDIPAKTQRCRDLDRMVEALTFVSEVSAYSKIPTDMSVDFWSGKVPEGFVARLSTSPDYKPATKFVATSMLKTAAAAFTGGPVGVIASIPGLVAGAGQFLLQDVMGDLCERMEGPLSATFVGESFTTAGERFFDYTIAIDGKVVVLYEKDAPLGQSVPLVGYLEGNGRFEVHDNPEPIVRLTPGQVLFHKVISPPGSAYWDEIGQFSRALLPHSFRIPLKGRMEGDSIVLALAAADHDFSDAIKGRSIYVVMPTGGLVPQIIDSPIALQKAQPIIDRVVRRHPVLKITHGAKETVAQGTFARDTTNASKTARVRTQLTMKACTPGCLPLPLSPKTKKTGGQSEGRP